MGFLYLRSTFRTILGLACCLSWPLAAANPQSLGSVRPAVNADLLVTASEVPLAFSGDRLLANDHLEPTNAATIVIVEPPVHGVLVNDHGELLYQPAAGFVGEDAFTYSWVGHRDGRLQPPARVSIQVSPRFQPLAGDWDDDSAGELGAFASFLSRFVLCEGARGDLVCLELDTDLDLMGWTAIYGDWDGDGKTDVGAREPSTGEVVLYLTVRDGKGRLEGIELFDRYLWIPPGTNGFLEAAAGDFNGDGRATLALFDRDSQQVFLQMDDRSETTTVGFALAASELDLVVGDWDGDGLVTLGFYDPLNGTFHLSNDNASISQQRSLPGSAVTDLALAFPTQPGVAPELSRMDPLTDGPLFTMFENSTFVAPSTLLSKETNLAQIPPCPPEV